MEKTLVTGPATYPITLSELKTHLRIYDTNTSHDRYISRLIAGAVADAENFTGRKFITQTWKVFLDRWPGGDFIKLPFGQLQSVTHVKYTDTDGTQSTMSSDEYIVDTDSEPGKIVLGYGEQWPTATLYPSNPIEIQFVCGYGGHTLKSVTGATNATPIVATVTGHGYSSGDVVHIESVGGNTAANGTWVIEVVTADTFSLKGSAGNADYTSGGLCIRQTVPIDIQDGIMFYAANQFMHRTPLIAKLGITLKVDLKMAESKLWRYKLHG